MYRNKEYGSQLKDFKGLTWGKISPTDIDGMLEFSNKLFIIIETKYNGSPVPFGQKLALERICDAINNPPHRHCVIILTSHHSQGDIDMAQTMVTAYRENTYWFTEVPEVTLRDMIDVMRRKYLG
jgi:hypothetical protein